MVSVMKKKRVIEKVHKKTGRSSDNEDMRDMKSRLHEKLKKGPQLQWKTWNEEKDISISRKASERPKLKIQTRYWNNDICENDDICEVVEAVYATRRAIKDKLGLKQNKNKNKIKGELIAKETKIAIQVCTKGKRMIIKWNAQRKVKRTVTRKETKYFSKFW